MSALSMSKHTPSKADHIKGDRSHSLTLSSSKSFVILLLFLSLRRVCADKGQRDTAEVMQVEVEDDLTSSLQAMFIISSIAFLFFFFFFFEDRGSRVSVEFGEGFEIPHHPNAASRRETSNFAPLCHNQCLATKDFLGLERELIGQTVALPRLLGAPASTTGQRRTLLKANGLSANTRYPLQQSVGKNTTQAINGTVSAPPNSQEHEREQLEDGQVPQALQQEARRLNTEHAQNLQGTWSHPPCKSATRAKGTTKKKPPIICKLRA